MENMHTDVRLKVNTQCLKIDSKKLVSAMCK